MLPLLALSLLPAAMGMITPTTPDSSGIYPAGANCPIAWLADPTGVWNSFTIQLMTGPNAPMVELEVVAAGLDGTTGGLTSFSYPCPTVDINAPIYFYQFSQPGVANLTWTTRFTIASASGATVPAPNNADTLTPAPWGTGKLTGASAQGVTTEGILGASNPTATAALAAGGGASNTAAGAGTTPTAAAGGGGASNGNPGAGGAGNSQFSTAAGNGTPPGAEQPGSTSTGSFVPYAPGQSGVAGSGSSAKSAAAVGVRSWAWSDLVVFVGAVWVGVGMM